MAMRERAKKAYTTAAKKSGAAVEALEGTAATWNPTTRDMDKDAPAVGIEQRMQKLGHDTAGLQEMILYGIKGSCASPNTIDLGMN